MCEPSLFNRLSTKKLDTPTEQLDTPIKNKIWGIEKGKQNAMCANEYKQTLGAYNLITSEKKKKAQVGYVSINECGKNICISTLKHACAAQEMTISQLESMLKSFNSERKELCVTKRYLRPYKDFFTRNQRDVMHIRNRVLHISKTLQISPSIVIL